ncbi:UNVERIFIED_CONTAM: hypothetical protein PYX00_008704 [Menopon gallinae]|uniref:Uncharacterized protein n=1 Tax=Menopon gallinae TaxID=328185 RepID=A0AAW2HPD7_9NEOP
MVVYLKTQGKKIMKNRHYFTETSKSRVYSLAYVGCRGQFCRIITRIPSQIYCERFVPDQVTDIMLLEKYEDSDRLSPEIDIEVFFESSGMCNRTT